MTSLQLFRKPEPYPKVPDEWGTGKGKGETDIWLPRGPTWHQRTIPVQQFYDLTELKRSNVRDNDQLLPRPEECQMGSMLINKSFPAEHPYDSHISKFAIFPNFTSTEDPIRGVAAQNQQPIHAEAPANSYDVQVLHKTKGAGIRHEIVNIPQESEKKPLYWHGENHFDQVVKTHGNRQNFYPIPPKSVAPNLQERPIEHKVSEKTADTMRNIERSHWLTSNQLQYSGLGPSNPVKLDNLDDKKSHFLNTGEIDDKLYSQFANTFDPPRPVEGRIARVNLEAARQQQNQTPQAEDTNNRSLQRKLTPSEMDEHRFWNGKEYINLPDLSQDLGADTRWREIDQASRTETMTEVLKLAQEGHRQDEVPFQPTGSPPEAEEGYLSTTKGVQDQRQQQIEAQNRWKLLESHTPRHDINSLHYKYIHLNDKEMPNTFYNHEGKYNEERVNMYQTSFDPHTLTYSMNKDEIAGAVITDTSRSHEDALYIPSDLSRDNNVLLKRSKTFCGNTPRMSEDIQIPRQVSAPYHELRNHQNAQLQPLPHTAKPLVQEGEFVLKESTIGDSYNTHKFLQDKELLPFARNEPLNLMSNENQNLRRVPARSKSLSRTAKSVQFSDRVTVAHLDASSNPFQINSAPLQGMTDDEKCELAKLKYHKTNAAQYTSRQAEWKKKHENANDQSQFTTTSNQLTQTSPGGYEPSFLRQPLPYSTTPRKTTPTINSQDNEPSPNSPERVAISKYSSQPGLVSSEYKNEFNGFSSGVVPTNLKRSFSFRSSYQSQFPIYHDMSFKTDPRFDWVPGSGTPRPQTCLLALQDSFSKTTIKQKLNREFPEKSPEIRNHITQGKRHVFNGVHGQLMHG